MTERPLAGRIAFVTGSGRGLGRAMADKLAELGADLAIHDRDAEQPAKYGEASGLDEVAREIGRHGGRVTSVLGNGKCEALQLHRPTPNTTRPLVRMSATA